jgi:hypothetical protein
MNFKKKNKYIIPSVTRLQPCRTKLQPCRTKLQPCRKAQRDVNAVVTQEPTAATAATAATTATTATLPSSVPVRKRDASLAGAQLRQTLAEKEFASVTVAMRQVVPRSTPVSPVKTVVATMTVAVMPAVFAVVVATAADALEKRID